MRRKEGRIEGGGEGKGTERKGGVEVGKEGGKVIGSGKEKKINTE